MESSVTATSEVTSNSEGTSDLGEVLARIDQRLARLERALQPALAASDQLPHIIATVADVVDEKAARLGDLEARMSALAEVTERLSRPQTLASLRKLVDMAESAPGLLATFTDMIDEIMDEAAQDGLELSRVVEDTKRLFFGLLKVTTSEELRALLDSGRLDTRAIRSWSQFVSAVVQASEKAAPRVGVLGVLRALRNRDVQRSLGFALQVAASFGRALGRDPAVDAPPKQLPSDAR